MSNTINTPYAPGSAGAGYRWVNEVWGPSIERAPYELDPIVPNITTMEALHGKLHIPQHANLSPNSRDTTNSTDMTDNLTFTGNVETELTITPGSVDLNVAVNEIQLKRMSIDPNDTLRTSIELAFTQKISQDVCTLFQVAVLGATGGYGAALDKSTIFNGKARLGKNTKEYGGAEIFFAFAHENEPAVLSTSDFISAYIRGQGGGAATSGRVESAFGITFLKTGNVRNAGGGYNNGMWIKKGLAISFNIKPYVKAQEHGHGIWLLGLTDYGYATVRDAYIGNCKSNVPTL